MKILIVYYSMSGNTDYVAKKIADMTGADLLRLEPKKAYPTSGFKKFLWGGKSAMMAEKPDLQAYQYDGAGYDMIVFGFPVWASNITPPLRTFIKENDLSGKRVAAFACQSGSGAEKAFEKLKVALGVEKLEATLVLIDPKVKSNSENEQKIREFCDAIK